MSPPVRLRLTSQSLRAGADHALSAASRSRSASVSPHSSVSTSALCCPSVGGGRRSQRVGAVEPGERRRRVQARAGAWMVEAFEEAAMAQLRVVGHQRRRHDGGRRNTCGRKHFDHGVAASCEAKPLAELGAAPINSAKRVPLGVGAHADRDPVVVARASVEILHRAGWPRLPRRDRISPKTSNSIVCAGGHVQHGLDHRHLDELTAACAVGELECSQERERRVRSGQRIAGAARRDRRPVGQAGHPRQARDLLHRRSEADAVAPRPRQVRTPASAPRRGRD